MNKKWTILFCGPESRFCPISSFMESCRPEHQVKLVRIMRLLEEMGPNLPRPYSDLLEDGIHELRVKLSGEQVRLLYFFCYESFIVFFEALRKHTDEVPEAYIQRTVRYRDKLLKDAGKEDLERFRYADA